MSRESINDARYKIIKNLNDLVTGSSLIRHADGSVGFFIDPVKIISTMKRDEFGILNIIEASCKKSESYAPGSTRLLVQCLLNIIKHGGVDTSSVDAAMNQITALSRHATYENIASCISDLLAREIVVESMKLAGAESKIFIEASHNKEPIVERVYGHVFGCTPNPSFLKEGKWVANNAACLIVDGIILSVSEIDGLLSKCNETKQAMVIFARGYGEDVLSTLNVNMLRKTLNVVPVVVGFDLESANVLADVAVVTGQDVISSLKGEIVSTKKLTDLPIVKACLTRSSAMIDPIHAYDVTNHIRSLVTRRRTEKLVDIVRILDKRIRSLSSSSVIIKFDDSGPHGSKLLYDIDAGLKIARNSLKHGVIDCAVIDSDICREIKGNVPALTLGAAIRYAKSTFDLIDSISLVIKYGL